MSNILYFKLNYTLLMSTIIDNTLLKYFDKIIKLFSIRNTKKYKKFFSSQIIENKTCQKRRHNPPCIVVIFYKYFFFCVG